MLGISVFLEATVKHTAVIYGNNLACVAFSCPHSEALVGNLVEVIVESHGTSWASSPQYRRNALSQVQKCALCNTNECVPNFLEMPRVIQASVQVGLWGFPQGENVFSGRLRGWWSSVVVRRRTMNSLSTEHKCTLCLNLQCLTFSWFSTQKEEECYNLCGRDRNLIPS